MTAKRPPIPALRYDDAPAAIDFLCRAFGFERSAVYADDKDPNLIHHAQLTFGGGMIMLGTARRGEVQQRYGWKTAREAGGVTVAVCLIVENADVHYETARTAGAEIVTEPHDNEGYPGRSYEARDPEANVWSITTYDPWADNPA